MPPPLQSAFCDFLLVYFWPYIMIICVLKRILHKKKSIFMQLLESPIPPLTAAALRMIICKRPAPLDDHLQEAGPSGSSFARGRPFRMTICKRPVPLDHHLQEAGPPFWQPRQGRENCIFETLYNEKRCVLSVKESNINEKKSKFSHLLSVRTELADPPGPPPPYGQPDRKMFFYSP